jgi:hypothetical protein
MQRDLILSDLPQAELNRTRHHLLALMGRKSMWQLNVRLDLSRLLAARHCLKRLKRLEAVSLIYPCRKHILSRRHK